MTKLLVTVALLMAAGCLSVHALPEPSLSHLFTLDCKGGMHLGVGSVLETNINVTPLMIAWEVLAKEIRSRARCAWYGASITVSLSLYYSLFLMHIPRRTHVHICNHTHTS